MHHNHLTDIFDDMDIVEPLPPWALRKSNGDYTELLAQLCTRDGRKVGNGVVTAVESHEVGIVVTVTTDIGNKLRLTPNELETLFYMPKYIMDPTYDHCKDA